MYKQIFKRFLDISIAIIAFISILPVFIFLCFVLAFTNRGGVFFIQNRVGRYGKTFQIIKFKTMTNLEDKEGNLLKDEIRLTLIGKLLRKASLDEIPQLLNVIKGEMSLVGPRPLLIEYLPLYNNFQRRRHEIRPGITGWAQVNGRNAINWNQKFNFDVWYVDNVNFILDSKIIFLTFLKILKMEGINHLECSTMSKFIGN